MDEILSRMTLDEVTAIDTSLKAQKARMEAEIAGIDADLEITAVLITALTP